MTQEIPQRLFQQVMDIWVKPEIRKRIKFGRISKDTELRAIQIIFSLDRGWAKVRLNKEVKAIVEDIDNKRIVKGELVRQQDLKNVTKITLTDQDPNCAHITLLRFKRNWIISFDFKPNKRRIKQHIEASREFYNAAKLSLKNDLLRPFFENAYACAELTAKSVLLTIPDKKILFETDHETRRLRFKGWANLGNVKTEYSTLLNRMTSLRPSARYLTSTQYKHENPKKILEALKEMIEFAERLIKI